MLIATAGCIKQHQLQIIDYLREDGGAIDRGPVNQRVARFFGSPKIYWGSPLVNMTDMLTSQWAPESSGTRTIIFPLAR